MAIQVQKQYLSARELAEFTGISVHTVYLWIQLRKIPYHKIGKMVRFNKLEIEDWLNAKRIGPVE